MTGGLRDPIKHPVRFHFFTGKVGVGKTSLACATAVGLADRGRRTLLVSTDPASGLDAVLGLAPGNASVRSGCPKPARHEHRSGRGGTLRDRRDCRTAGLPTQDAKLVPEHDDFQLVALPRWIDEGNGLKKPSKQEVADTASAPRVSNKAACESVALLPSRCLTWGRHLVATRARKDSWLMPALVYNIRGCARSSLRCCS